MYYELFFITGPCTLLLGCITLTTRHRSTTEWELSGPIRGLYRSWLESAQTTCKAVFSRRRPMRSRADARGPPRIHTGGGKRKREDTHAELPMGRESGRYEPASGCCWKRCARTCVSPASASACGLRPKGLVYNDFF
jgi:hypothetical protein